MADRPGHARHVVRVAVLFATGFVLFLVLRWAFVPKDFGVRGFYRDGALAEIAAKTPVFAGRDQCVVCHADTVDEKSKHLKLSCEGCHGAQAAHVGDPTTIKPPKLDERALCLRCHAKLEARPATHPQIDSDHGGDGKCTECHKPHHPQLIDQ